jgi:hypothetical protein
MKKMALILAIMALATGAFAGWDASATETFIWETSAAAADTIGGIGADVATIYARFKILGPEFQINIGEDWDMWQVTNFMPGDYNTQRDPFLVENTGGATLDLSVHRASITPASGDAVTAAAASAYVDGWIGTNNTLRMWAAIKRRSGTPATTTEIMTLANYIPAAARFYGESDYMEPVTGTYAAATGSSLTLYAPGLVGGDATADKCDIYLAAQMPFAGWTAFGTQTIEFTVTGRLTYAP